MKKAIILSLVLAISASVAAQEKAKTTPTQNGGLYVYVTVQGGKVMAVLPSALAKLPRKEVKGKDHDGKDVNYSGYDLREVLKLAGTPFGDQLRGRAMTYYLVVEAADNYHAVFALAELDDTYTDKVVLLADTQDGKPLDSKSGYWQLVVPDEKKHARWVRQVTALKVFDAQINPRIETNSR